MTASNQAFAEMGTEKAGPAGNQDSLDGAHEIDFFPSDCTLFAPAGKATPL